VGQATVQKALVALVNPDDWELYPNWSKDIQNIQDVYVFHDEGTFIFAYATPEGIEKIKSMGDHLRISTVDNNI